MDKAPWEVKVALLLHLMEEHRPEELTRDRWVCTGRDCYWSGSWREYLLNHVKSLCR